MSCAGHIIHARQSLWSEVRQNSLDHLNNDIADPHLRQPLASRGSAKTRAGSNHGEPTPLTLASRCGSVGPLFRPVECTTPDLPGEYDIARGSQPQDVGVALLRPHSQHPTKGAQRRRTTSRLSTSPPKLTKRFDEPTGLKPMVCPGRPKKQQR